MCSELWRVVRGDAVRALRNVADGTVDAFVTDPPYGIELKLGTKRTGRARSIAGDGRAEAKKLWREWIPEAYRAAKPDTAHVVFGTWKSPWMFDALAAHFDVKGCIAWDKRVIGLGHFLRPRWEMAYLCVKGRPPRRVVPAPADVWECARVHRVRHPCEKPIDLLRRAVRLVASPGELVCDPFAGIFSSGVAALLEGCRFLGMELDGRYCGLGEQRLEQAANGIRT